MQETIATILQNQFCTSHPLANTKPSCHAVAVWRAAHQLLERPPIFSDPAALTILGDAKSDVIDKLEIHKDALSSAMRVAVCVRSRFAEDERNTALQSGVNQYVILGAGLDTYAYRQHNKNEQVFEVDLPATQDAKVARLADLSIQPTCTVNYVACDFEQNSLEENLTAAGFDKSQKTFFSWLGVIPYLDNTAIAQTLQFITSCTPGSTVVFDYIVSPDNLNEIERIALNLLSAQLAKGGEPLKSAFDPQVLLEKLESFGFSIVENIGPEYLNHRYLIQREDGLRVGNVTRMFKAVV